jgi:hypothetical protein
LVQRKTYIGLPQNPTPILEDRKVLVDKYEFDEYDMGRSQFAKNGDEFLLYAMN